MLEILSAATVQSDERGSIVQIAEEPFALAALITSAPGTVRGGHRHLHSTETFYILSGACRVFVQSGDKKEEYTFRGGDMFRIHKDTYHHFTFLQQTQMLELHDLPLRLPDGTLDTIRGLPQE